MCADRCGGEKAGAVAPAFSPHKSDYGRINQIMAGINRLFAAALRLVRLFAASIGL